MQFNVIYWTLTINANMQPTKGLQYFGHYQLILLIKVDLNMSNVILKEIAIFEK